MSWKCQECGRAEATPPRQCPGCGAMLVPRFVLLTSEATGQVVRCGGATHFGRALLQRKLQDPDAVYAAERQFEVSKDEARGVWLVRGLPGTPNPTLVNGSPAGPDGVELTVGAVITLGKSRMRMRVSFEP